MSETLVLDSNAIIALFGGDKGVARIMASASAVMVPTVVCGELDAGMQGNTVRVRRERELFEGLLALPKVSAIPLTRKTAAYYGRIYDYVRSHGGKFPTNDIWIAAAALEYGASICTNDKHFLGLPFIGIVTF